MGTVFEYASGGNGKRATCLADLLIEMGLNDWFDFFKGAADWKTQGHVTSFHWLIENARPHIIGQS